MRACMKRPEFIGDEETGEVTGLYLGYDHCSEHEWGIKGLRAAFGLPRVGEEPDKLGLARLVPTQVPEKLFWHKWKDGSEGIVCAFVWKDRDEQMEQLAKGELCFNISGFEPLLTKKGKPYKNGRSKCVYHTMSAAWDERSFAVRASDWDEIIHLHLIYEALQEKNCTIQLGGPDSNNPFGGSGLCFFVVDKLPEDLTQARYDADEDYFKIREWVKSTGIEEELKAADKGWFALSPKRNDHDRNGSLSKEMQEFQRSEFDKHGRVFQTPVVAKKGDIIFWLNPHDQKNNHSCWCTLQDLKDWVEGKGRIPKSEEYREYERKRAERYNR